MRKVMTFLLAAGIILASFPLFGSGSARADEPLRTVVRVRGMETKKAADPDWPDGRTDYYLVFKEKKPDVFVNAVQKIRLDVDAMRFGSGEVLSALVDVLLGAIAKDGRSVGIAVDPARNIIVDVFQVD